MNIFILLVVLVIAIGAIVISAQQGNSKNTDTSTSVLLIQKETDVQENVSVGFSWQVLFFGSIPMLLRSDYVNALKTIVIKLLVFISVTSFYSQNLITESTSVYLLTYLTLLSFITNIALAMGYNKAYASMLLEVGFKPATDTDKKALLTAKVKNV